MAESDLTAARLRDLLHYDPKTGNFVWRVKHGRKVVPGKTAGCLESTRGYVVIRIDGKGYKAHRLAFLYQTGEMPTAQIDHRDGVKTNNSWDNLRPATVAENGRNRRPGDGNTSGVCGVLWRADKSKWRATIKKHGCLQHLGYFTDLSDAIEARRTAELQQFEQFSPLASRAR